MTIQECAALLRGQDDILILTHRRPDGDTVGCAAGLCAALRQIGKRAAVLYNPEITENNRLYLEEYWAAEDFAPKFVVAVDIASRSMFSPAAQDYLDRVDLTVDHHPSQEFFARDLIAAVGNDFVGVHVRLRTGTGLPDDEREMTV